ncbi:rhomboid family intramembrane serine protease [Natronorubrum aibiense]|uniref:Rhomboid family intramembrane serine protease n=1 Tax=Natronorubrum aibiense TaxID=348826 RepID=A0A5P9P6L2_9EURY|nr:rhomboid family intramembrane serine protease [Natronorubrum aibiense]QFU83778.1 rhomboid family intramembrane serine protease [Natronorubrum aibiense]
MFSTGALLRGGLALLTVVALLVSLAVVSRLHRSERGWLAVARSRLVMGVPWGSLVVIAFVCSVYLFVQDGLTAFDDPVTIPYRAYSYFYPLGMLTAPFSHASSGHLIGNLSGTLVVAPIAEYAWGHYPNGRDSEAGDSWRADPWVRALILFPLAVVGIGLLTSLFALGPVIGFSGVVFAFAAFALVQYPITTIVGVLGVQSVALILYRALQTPIRVYVAEPRPPSAPSWAGIAIQGHALGFFIGLVLGLALLRSRSRYPNPLRLWAAVLLYGFVQGLWQLYWFGSEDTFILYQGPGVLLVIVLALVITLAAADPRDAVFPRRLERALGRIRPRSDSPVDRPLEIARAAGEHTAAARPRLERIGDLAAGTRTESTIDRRRTASALVLLVLAVLAGMAVPLNFFVLDDSTASSDTAIEIEDYTVQYAEGVENELTAPVQIGPLENAVSIDSSGVIVASERRQLWAESVPTRRLAFTGEESIVVGGPGWRETVHVERTGWEPVGNDTVYQVEIWADGDDRQLAHESNASRADVRIDNRTVTIASDDGTFVLNVESLESGTVETTPIPDDGASTTAGGLTFEREEETIYASSDGTRIAVASAETYD